MSGFQINLGHKWWPKALLWNTNIKKCRRRPRRGQGHSSAVKAFATMPDHWAPTPGPTDEKEHTDAHELSSDLHRCSTYKQIKKLQWREKPVSSRRRKLPVFVDGFFISFEVMNRLYLLINTMVENGYVIIKTVFWRQICLVCLLWLLRETSWMVFIAPAQPLPLPFYLHYWGTPCSHPHLNLSLGTFLSCASIQDIPQHAFPWLGGFSWLLKMKCRRPTW